MSFFDRLGELTKSLFNINLELRYLQEQQAQDRQAVRDLDTSLKQLARDLQSVSERLTRLETIREADRAELRAEIARFNAEVERAALRMERRQLPPAQTENGDE